MMMLSWGWKDKRDDGDLHVRRNFSRGEWREVVLLSDQFPYSESQLAPGNLCRLLKGRGESVQ